MTAGHLKIIWEVVEDITSSSVLGTGKHSSQVSSGQIDIVGEVKLQNDTGPTWLQLHLSAIETDYTHRPV